MDQRFFHVWVRVSCNGIQLAFVCFSTLARIPSLHNAHCVKRAAELAVRRTRQESIRMSLVRSKAGQFQIYSFTENALLPICGFFFLNL
jgi:hypothetical protein